MKPKVMKKLEILAQENVKQKKLPKIHFYLSLKYLNKNKGVAPIYTRLTLTNQFYLFNTGIYIPEGNFINEEILSVTKDLQQEKEQLNKVRENLFQMFVKPVLSEIHMEPTIITPVKVEMAPSGEKIPKERFTCFNVRVGFYAREKRVKQPPPEYGVYCRIVYCKKQIEFHTGINVIPEAFQNGKIVPYSDEYIEYQRSLDALYLHILKAFNDLKFNNGDITPARIRDIVRGDNHSKETGKDSFKAISEEFLKNKSKLIGIDFDQKMYDKYERRIGIVNSFIRKCYSTSDFKIIEIRDAFVNEFYTYCRSTRCHSKLYIRKTIQTLKSVIDYAVKYDYAPKNYIKDFKIKGERAKDIKHLSLEQMKVLMEAKFGSMPLNYVRDCFLFQCFTGLAYADLYKFSAKDITKDSKGALWIIIERQKTSGKSIIPLFDEALELLKKYEDLSHRADHNITSPGILPVYPNAVMNRLLKQIGLISNIPLQYMCTHTARKTFAMTMLNRNGVSLETVGGILGHAETRTTHKYYAKVSQAKISSEIGSKNFFEN